MPAESRDLTNSVGVGVGVVAVTVAVTGASAVWAVRAATKFAQVGRAGALDREVRPEGIRVTASMGQGS